MNAVHAEPPSNPTALALKRALVDAVPAIDEAYLRLLQDPTNDRDCDTARELLFARIEVASAADAMGDMVTKNESRDAVGAASFVVGGFCLLIGMVMGAGGEEFFARFFG